MAGTGDDWRGLYQGETPDSDFGYISYNETVMEHFMSPRNVGVIDDSEKGGSPILSSSCLVVRRPLPRRALLLSSPSEKQSRRRWP